MTLLAGAILALRAPIGRERVDSHSRIKVCFGTACTNP
jgi:hypothetical protein